MAYAVWLIALALLLVLVKQYYASKMNHAAAANAVFAKYTFGTLSSDQQTLVKQKVAESTSEDKLDEIQRYGWYAIAMHALDIPSAVPENPVWYHKVKPDKVYPSDMLLNSVISFVDKNYSIKVEFDAEEAVKDQPKAVASDNETKPSSAES